MSEEREQKYDGDRNADEIEQNGPHVVSFLDKLHVIALAAADGGRIAGAKRAD